MQGWKANYLRLQNGKYYLLGVEFPSIKQTVAMNRNVPQEECQEGHCDSPVLGLSGRAADLSQPTSSSHIADFRSMIRLEY